MNLSRTEKIIFGITALLASLHFMFHSVRVLGKSTSIFYYDEQVSLAVLATVCFAFWSFTKHLELVKSIGKKYLSEIAFAALSLIFVLDEYLEIHEYINETLKSSGGGESMIATFASYSWVLTIGVIVLAILTTVAYFAVKEPVQGAKRYYFAFAACLFFVLCIELYQSDKFGQNIYSYLVGVEESLEIMAMGLLVLAADAKISSKKNLTK